MSILNPLQEEVKNQFLANYVGGGLEACRAMVTDLAAEVQMAVAVSEGAEEARHEVILRQEEMSFEEIVAHITTLNDIPTAAAEVMSRYSFALYLLRIVEKGTGAAPVSS